LSHGINSCRLLAHFVWIADCPLSATAPGGGRFPAASGIPSYNCSASITAALNRLSAFRLKAAVMEYWEIMK
jgi:hypothetical protein